MKLTDNETKLLFRLRKGEKDTVRYRYRFLGYGILNVALASIGMIYIQPLVMPVSSSLHQPILPYFTPSAVLFLFSVGMYQVATSLCYWNGNPSKALLLKLIDEQLHSTLTQSTQQSHGADGVNAGRRTEG